MKLQISSVSQPSKLLLLIMCELMVVVSLFKTKSYLTVADEKGQEMAEGAEGPLIIRTPIGVLYIVYI